MRVSFSELDNLLSRTPVMGEIHPLAPLALSAGTKITGDSHGFARELDNQILHEETPHLMLDANRLLSSRFPRVTMMDHPPIDLLNTNMGSHLEYARSALLTNHKIAEYIQADIAKHPSDVVVLFLVDGLGYRDVSNWHGEIQPCFIDGPSVTYRFYEDNKDKIVETVGFASIINRPSVYQRLYDLGYHHARGYTYWEPDSNAIADFMFAGIPYERVSNFDTIVMFLEREQLLPHTYIQLVRQGLDGLAHGKRELHSREIDMAAQSILADVKRLQEILQRKRMRVRIYLTADHGILWRKELQPVQVIQALKDSHARFAERRPEGAISNSWVRFENSFVPYYLFRFPFLGTQLKNNDNGVHGGLSYQESIVPFIKFEV